ncbi:MAG: hypothetical protein N3B18_05650 [Desulfobacterota bacterium]|nr:hypothetical protein [Thermodesulfobacteriota bacterium]
MLIKQSIYLKTVFVFFTLKITLLFFCCPLWGLSPPQYSLWRQVNATIGASAFVEIGEMQEMGDGQYEFDIRCRCVAVSSALAAVLVTEYNFGGIELKIHVLNPDGSQAANPLAGRKASSTDEIRGYFEKALAGNKLISRLLDGDNRPFGFAFWVECKPKVVQFWNDNIGDYHGYDTYVAADVFRTVMKTSFETELGDIAVGFTTRPVMVIR